MKIWIDGYEANVAQRLGSSQVAFELISHFEKIDKKNDYTVVLPSKPLDDMPKERPGFKYKILKPKRFWTQVTLPWALYKEKLKPDVIFSPTHYIPRFSPVKRIVTIFDLSFLHFPESFLKKDLWKLRSWTKFSVENADHIITISNFSKKDIISQYGIKKNKITVTYPGYDKEKFQIQSSKIKIDEVKTKYKITDPYIIHIGTIQPRKNLIRLMEAVSKMDNMTLVVAGKTKGEGRQGWMYEDILKTPQNLGIQKRVIFTGFTKTEDLPYLLSGAKAFVLPSLWEGFGIPAVEAMACGTPVIVSNVSSLPEVVGKAGILVDPYSVDQIEHAVRVVVSDKKIREKYVKESLMQAKKFSWEKMAKAVLASF